MSYLEGRFDRFMFEADSFRIMLFDRKDGETGWGLGVNAFLLD